MEMAEEEFINNVEGHITSLKNLDNKALKILVGKLEKENKELKEHKENLIRADKNKSDHIDELEEENKKLKEENRDLRLENIAAYRVLQRLEEEKEGQKSKTITVTDEDNRIILEKGEDGKRHSYGGGNVVLC